MLAMDDAPLKRIDRRLEVTEQYVRQSAEYVPRIAAYIRQGNEHLQEARAAGERRARAAGDLRIAVGQCNLRQRR